MMMTENIPLDDDYKCYKVKPYKNSDQDPFGITISGKTKDYISAHNNFRRFIKKGKSYNIQLKNDEKMSGPKGAFKF